MSKPVVLEKVDRFFILNQYEPYTKSNNFSCVNGFLRDVSNLAESKTNDSSRSCIKFIKKSGKIKLYLYEDAKKLTNPSVGILLTPCEKMIADSSKKKVMPWLADRVFQYSKDKQSQHLQVLSRERFDELVAAVKPTKKAPEEARLTPPPAFPAGEEDLVASQTSSVQQPSNHQNEIVEEPKVENSPSVASSSQTKQLEEPRTNPEPVKQSNATKEEKGGIFSLVKRFISFWLLFGWVSWLLGSAKNDAAATV